MNGFSPPVPPPVGGPPGRAPRRPSRRTVAATVTALLLFVTAALTGAPATARPADPDRTVAAPSTQVQAQAQVLTWTAGDNFTSYLSAPTTAVAGPATLVFENSRATGNTTGMQHTLTFETGDPRYNSDVDVNILADPTDANGGRWTVDVTLTPGTYRYFCSIPGHGGMTGLLVVSGGTSDTTAPTVTAAVTGTKDAAGAYVGSATVNLSATDAGSGVDKVEYAVDGGAWGVYTAPVTVNAPGQHTVSYRATDRAGNTSTVAQVSFTVVEPAPTDTTAPTVTAAVTGQKDAAGAYVGSATVTLSATDTESGVAKVEYSLDGGAYATYTAPLSVTAAGQHTVSYRATDKAGNTSAAQQVTFTVVEPAPTDGTPPTATAAVTGQKDATGAYVGSATVTVTATDAGSGVAKIEYALDGGAWTAYTAPVTVNAAGQHTLSYRATDKAGNTSAAQQVAFTVVAPAPTDTTAPTATAAVTGTKDADGRYVGGATVTVTASDAGSGVAKIEYSLDGQPYATYTAPVTVNQTGPHTVSYRATDKAGNTSTAQQVTFTVVDPPAPDTTPPTAAATVAGQLDADGGYVGSATVTLTAADSGSGVAKIEYALDGGAWTTYSAPVTVNAAGQHTLSYRATDKAGNVSTAGSVTFTVVASGGHDACAVPDTRPTVWLGTVDSGVPNRKVDGDCTINNLIGDAKTWTNHGAFVTHINEVAEHLHHLGLLEHAEHGKLTSAAARSGVGKPDVKNGYQPLLDTSAASFARWEHVGAGGFTRNTDGSVSSRAVPGMGMLWFPATAYGDFSLKLQWRDDAPGDGRANSGVFVRFPDPRHDPRESRPEWVAVKYGHELQIHDRTDGDAYKTGSVYGFDRVDLAGARVTPKGTWNDYEIRVVGQHYQIYRNGELINDYANTPDAVFSPPRADDPGGAGRQSATGHVGLQNHGAGDLVSFRNVRIAPLTPAS
ncbi:OmpL47-type beta-barrel domain-containing protein [Micromonospora siamensis]|uniref:Ig-like domain (Group 3) n=1 Tax=Micromonospora siamensis TaxID=299152 RepID=A0A1C5IQ00_9ACTN|nr:family 16 glycoside hydrolase [Micromonospora siamensis]SCG60418.1 Ig-like domain (group 3) [Micromonospora siamensis]